MVPLLQRAAATAGVALELLPADDIQAGALVQASFPCCLI
jgi:hypothetical protein